MVRIEPDEATESLLVYLGAEFHPPAIPEPEPPPMPVEIEEEIEEPQPVVPGQPTAGSPRVKKGGRKRRGRGRWQCGSAPQASPQSRGAEKTPAASATSAVKEGAVLNRALFHYRAHWRRFREMRREDQVQVGRRSFLLGWVPFFHRQETKLCGIPFRVIRHGRSPRRYLMIHGDEDTARDVLAKYIGDHDGAAYGVAYIVTGKERTVEIRGLRVDPNRLFSRAGADFSIRGLNPGVDVERLIDVLDYLDRGRGTLLKHLTPGKGSRLFALHNNRDYSVQDELAASNDTSIKQPAQPRNFFLCTDREDFGILKQSPYNVVLQSEPNPDDGSLSRLAALRGFRYINLECAVGEYDAQMERVRWADEHLP